MIKFIRISTVYPIAAKNINNEISKKKNLDYNKLLKEVFLLGFGENNNITKELSKKNYDCNEIISNVKYLQKAWSREYLRKKSNKKIILEQILFYKPNVIYFGNYSLLTKDLLKEIRKLNYVKLVMVFHCSPITSEIEKKLKLADIVITCTDGYKKDIKKKIKKKAYKIAHAFNPVFKNIKNFEERKIDVSFIGSLYIKSGLHFNRINFIYHLLKNFKNSYIAINFSMMNIFHILKLFMFSNSKLSLIEKLNIIFKLVYIMINSRKTVYGNKMLKILSNTKILVNSHIEDTKYAGNMRLFEGTGSGCMILTDKKYGLNKLFSTNKEIITYKNTQDMIYKIKYFLENDKKLRQVANNGFRRTVSDHNYKKRILILNKIIKKYL